MTLLFVQLADVCPKPRHLKHLGMFLGIGLGLISKGKFICGVSIFNGVEGIGGELFQLPLLRVCLKGKDCESSFWEGLGYSCLKGFLLFCCSTLCPNTHTSSKSGKLLELYHVSILRFESTQVSHNGLFFKLMYATLD